MLTRRAPIAGQRPSRSPWLSHCCCLSLSPAWSCSTSSTAAFIPLTPRYLIHAAAALPCAPLRHTPHARARPAAERGQRKRHGAGNGNRRRGFQRQLMRQRCKHIQSQLVFEQRVPRSTARRLQLLRQIPPKTLPRYCTSWCRRTRRPFYTCCLRTAAAPRPFRSRPKSACRCGGRRGRARRTAEH